MEQLLDRFLRYVKIDTQSAEESATFPSTEKQKTLARLLCEELKHMGAKDVRMEEAFGYVYAQLPATRENRPDGSRIPAIGFVAHMDTSPAVSGREVKPRVIRSYDGGDIALSADGVYVLSPQEYPQLKERAGKTLVVTDGSTLLGGDDKAGVAEIMTLAERLLSHPEIGHGPVRIAFTPDEEVGGGTDHFDLDTFAADFAYTVDGGGLGELEYENFNAAEARLTVSGVSVHPGDARGKMLNAILLAQEFQSLLPVYENPAATSGYEGFYHPDTIKGSVDEVTVEYIIRDHDRNTFEKRKAFFTGAASFLNGKYGKELFRVQLRDSYYNMREKLLPHFHLIENAKAAMRQAGVEPKVQPIRGGTDGARLSYMGLPCPNLCTGGYNFHGRYEYVCVEEMEKTVEILQNILTLYAR